MPVINAVMVFKTTEFAGRLTVSAKWETALVNWPELFKVLLALNNVTNHRNVQILIPLNQELAQSIL